MARKDIINFGVAVGGVPINSGAGEGAFLAVVAPTTGGAITGEHGDVVHHGVADNVYVATISLLETSEINAQLEAVYAARLLPGTGTTDVMLIDIGTGEMLQGPASFVKPPDRTKNASVATYEWVLSIESRIGWTTQAPTPIVP